MKEEPQPEEGRRRKRKKKLVPSRPAPNSHAREQEKDAAETEVSSARSDVSTASKVGAVAQSAATAGTVFNS